jgi:soluble P-type ATPase
MIQIDIPDFGKLSINHLVLDYNGTLACDGDLLPGVEPRLQALSEKIDIHVVTADTFGKVRKAMNHVSCEVAVLPGNGQAQRKLDFITNLGGAGVAAIGNGRNDRLMIAEAALGIAVVLQEGASRETVYSADILCNDICAALDLFVNPLRIVATLRS